MQTEANDNHSNTNDNDWLRLFVVRRVQGVADVRIARANTCGGGCGGLAAPVMTLRQEKNLAISNARFPPAKLLLPKCIPCTTPNKQCRHHRRGSSSSNRFEPCGFILCRMRPIQRGSRMKA